jgi:hypothetical protein
VERRVDSLARGLWALVRVHDQHIVPCLSLKDALSRDEPVCDAPERIDVDASIDVGLEADHFRSHDRRRPNETPLVLQLFCGGMTIHHQTEIEHLGEVVLGTVMARIDVARLDVPVHKVVQVCLMERVTGLPNEMRNALGGLAAKTLDEGLQIDASE